MASKEEFIEYFKRGRPTSYDKKKHIPLLYQVFDNEEGIFAFCDEALITRQTFYNWLRTHDKFKEAYDMAICRSARKWEQLPRNNLNIAHPYWVIIMKNRFGYFKPMLDIKPNDKPANRIETIWEGIREGELSTQEATQLASLVVTQANIESNNTDSTNPFKIQTSEQIKERADAITQLLEANRQLEEMGK